MENKRIEHIESMIEREQKIIANCGIKIKEFEIKLRHEQKKDYEEYINSLMLNKYVRSTTLSYNPNSTMP